MRACVYAMDSEFEFVRICLCILMPAYVKVPALCRHVYAPMWVITHLRYMIHTYVHTFTHAYIHSKFFRPNKWSIRALTAERDLLPLERQINELELTYSFEQTEKDAIKCIPRIVGLADLLYDSPYESQVGWVILCVCVCVYIYI